MSDEEDEVVYVKKQKTIHYGSLEETMELRTRQTTNESENSSVNINNIPEYFDIDSEM